MNEKRKAETNGIAAFGSALDELVKEHVRVTGGSGSGKSALILAPLVSQVIDRGDRSVVFIDQKNDPASFWNCFDSAYRAGMQFKYFTVPGEEGPGR